MRESLRLRLLKVAISLASGCLFRVGRYGHLVLVEGDVAHSRFIRALNGIVRVGYVSFHGGAVARRGEVECRFRWRPLFTATMRPSAPSLKHQSVLGQER